MLIRNAEIWGKGTGDVRIEHGRIAELGALPTRAGEDVLDADGGALLPGLHDHHIHMTALAARRSSVFCGPPEVMDADALAARIGAPGTGWLRGIGYHESVAGMLDAAALDRMAGDRPVRIQHRSGRMWFLNSAALERLLKSALPPDGLEKAGGQFSGRLFDEDRWLHQAMASAPPGFAEVSATLASYGVSGVTDMSPTNDPAMASHFSAERQDGALRQRCLMAGALSLDGGRFDDHLRLGPAKLHLHEADFPPFDEAVTFVRAAHGQGRTAAVHCVTEAELVFALGVFEDAGTVPGDRIEHVSVTPDPLVADIAEKGLSVVTQPHFIAERGDEYRDSVEPRDLPQLYRLNAFLEAGVVLAGGSDAPFGGADPWAAMAAAVSRQTGTGCIMGEGEALTPEQALALYLADPEDLGRTRRIEVGAVADLCLLDRPWGQARARLSAGDLRATVIGGSVVYDRVNEAPVERRLCVDPLA